jgi:aminocarboxymuconate-semialdehyde decarboxylase
MPIRIDCDSHFFPRDVFDEVDPRFEDRRPRVWFDGIGRSAITYPEREAKLSHHQRHVLQNIFRFSPTRPGFWDPGPRIEFLDELGIQMQVLVPSNESFHYDVEPDLATSVCQSYNNAISRVLKGHPGRFIGLAHLPMQSPTRAVKEIDRAVTELGLHAAAMFTNVNGRNLDEPEFWPVYARIEELGVPLILHPSRSGTLLGLERLTKFHLDNALGFLYEGSLAITSLICGGVLDLFPRLRVALLETGSGYLPYLMDRLNEVYDHEGVDKLIRKRPHEYLDQFWLSANVAAEKETMVYVVQRFGANRLMMAVDFPHGLGGAGRSAVDEVLTNPGLDQEQKDRILGLNAAELFGIATD